MNNGLAAFNKAKYARFGYPLGGLGDSGGACLDRGGAWFGGKCVESSGAYRPSTNDARALCASKGGSWNDATGCSAAAGGMAASAAASCVRDGGFWTNGQCTTLSTDIVVTGKQPDQPQTDEGPGVFSQALDALQFWKPSAPRAQFQWNTPNSTPYLAIGVVALALVGGYLLWRNS